MLYFLFLAISFSQPGFSKVYINVGSARVQKSHIAISPFILKQTPISNSNLKKGNDLFSHLKKNIKFSGYFYIVPQEAFLEDITQKAPLPASKDSNGFHFEKWAAVGANFLLINSYSLKNKNLTVTSSLFDINVQKQVFKKTYTESTKNYLRISDLISNDISKYLIGTKGIFETKILAVKSTSGSKKELVLMNWDGSKEKQISFHRSIVVSPAWRPNGEDVSYTAYVYNKKLKKRIPTLFSLNLATRRIQVLYNQSGANLSSDFFKNKSEILLTLSKGAGNTDIFKWNFKSKILKPLTNGPRGTINVEPSINQTTGHISFASDRSGETMIYTMNPQGENIKRITFAGKYNSNPIWSPTKNQIVFSGYTEDHFDLFSINSDGTGLKRLTSMRKKNGKWANCESPSFSPNGRFIVFVSDASGVYQLYILNIDSLSVEQITFNRHNYKSPKWSPYLRILSNSNQQQ